MPKGKGEGREGGREGGTVGGRSGRGRAVVARGCVGADMCQHWDTQGRSMWPPAAPTHPAVALSPANTRNQSPGLQADALDNQPSPAQVKLTTASLPLGIRQHTTSPAKVRQTGKSCSPTCWKAALRSSSKQQQKPHVGFDSDVSRFCIDFVLASPSLSSAPPPT